MSSFYSSSQVTDYRECHRLWALKKPCGHQEEKKNFQTTGTETHAEVEAFLHTGVLPTGEHATKVKAAAAHLHRDPEQLIEHYIAFRMWPGGPVMVGYIDQVEPPKMTTEGLVAGIVDHKTTSDFRYNKTPEELLSNTQLVTYAYWLYRLPKLDVFWLPVPPTEAWRPVWEEGLDVVNLAHIYVKTKNVVREGKAVPVRTPISWERVAKEWATIEADVRDMEALRATAPAVPEAPVYDWGNIEASDAALEAHRKVVQTARTPWALTVPGNRARCDKYRGCDFRPLCPEAALPYVRPEDQMVSVDDMLRKLKEDEDMDKPAANTDELTERLRARMGIKPGVAPVAVTAPPKEVVAPPVEVVAGPAVTPPDAAPRVDTPGDLEPGSRHAEPADPPPVKTKGRKRNSGPATTSEAAHPTNTPPEPEKGPGEAVATSGGDACTPVVNAFPPAGALFVNCRPLMGMGTFDELAWTRWMGGLLEDLHKELKVLDYRLVEYGKGPGALAAFMKARLDTAPAVCIVNTSHPEANMFLAAALPRAVLVVK